MKQTHHPIDQKTYEKGVNSDMNPEILGSQDGFHIDAVNMRSLPMDGDNFAKKKIKGEQLLYPAIDNGCWSGTGAALSSNYHCMATLEIQNHIIEFWADRTAVQSPFIRVDGKIVCKTPALPVYYSHPIQVDKNENCVGGEFYVTNKLTPPMVFSLKDMMLNGGMNYGTSTGVCSDKYFDGFNIDEYTININSSLYKPAFIKTVIGTSGTYDQVFGSNGLVVGSYSYSYRYVTPSGDRTNWSPITELIPAVRSYSLNDGAYPGNRTHGDDPDITSTTDTGNHVRLRYYNNLNFEFIEIRRDSWYNGDGIGNPPISEIIGSVNIPSGVGIINFLDRVGSDEAQEIITLEEQTNQMTSVQSAKAIRYYNERLYLMNIKYQSKDVDDSIDLIDENDPVVPFVENIGKFGHKDTYHATHHKSNMRGEKVSTAIVLFDEANNVSYAKKIQDNYQFPNRRDVASSDSINLSYKGIVTAANVNDTTSETFEVFDTKNCIQKSNLLLANVLDDNSAGPYDPYNPTSQTDIATNELNEVVNIEVGSGDVSSPLTAPYNPKAFAPEYFSMGYAFKGIDTSSKPIPSWASGFSVVQSDPANRVLAQGLAYYKLINPEGSAGPNGGKSVNTVHVYFPDLDENTGINPQIVDSLLNTNGSGFKLQMVSPLGFFTEVYSFYNNLTGAESAVDMITYNRVLREDGSINPTSSTSNSGFNGYTGFGKWRNPTQSGFYASNNGNAMVDITNVTLVTSDSGVSKYLELELSSSIYNETGANGDRFEYQDGVKEWQEPMYVVNLIQDSALVPSGVTTQYKYTGNFVKFNSIIYEVGQAGEPGFSVPLVSERWEDCAQFISTNGFSTYNLFKRFVYVKDSLGVERRWMNVTGMLPANLTALLTDISTNGFSLVTDPSGTYQVYGVYTSSDVQDSSATVVSLTFNWIDQNFPKDIQVPPALSTVTVKYDNRIPVRVFGGDTWINESVWAVKDNLFDKNNNLVNPTGDTRIELPFPYGSYFISSGITIIRNGSGLDKIQSEHNLFFTKGTTGASIRQLISMWTAETRINLSFNFNDESVKHSVDQTFPLKNYVIRPYKWDDSGPDAATVYADNNIYPDYETDYGDEYINWQMGGFRFRPQTNIDYSKSQSTLLITSTPTVGFDEQTDFCTRIIWSEKRPINVQNTPTVRTFPPGNFYDISDDTGEIKRAFSAISSDKGNNLYAFTDSGICLLLVDKRIIHEINATELATVGSDIGGILNELWIDKTIGMFDETWRSAAEYSNAIFWVNNTSAYLFGDNQVNDIGSTGFKERLTREFIPLLGSSYSKDLTGGYDVLHQEYIVGFDRSVLEKERPQRTLIYGVQQKALQCRSSYDYDQYLYIGNKLHGFKDAKSYELGIGNQINGVNITASVTGVSDKELYFDKEFIRIRVNSNFKPETISFYDSYADYLAGNESSIVDSISNPLSIKDYYGYECYIPRKTVAPYGRQQGRVVLFKIQNSANEEFLVTSTGVQYKTLK